MDINIYTYIYIYIYFFFFFFFFFIKYYILISCCRDTSEYSNGVFGITIDSPNSMRKVKLYGEKSNQNGEIAAGYIPGSTSCNIE